MRIIRTLATLLLLAGLVCAVQGAGVVGGMPMSGHARWLVIGVGCAVVGFLVLHWTAILRNASH